MDFKYLTNCDPTLSLVSTSAFTNVNKNTNASVSESVSAHSHVHLSTGKEFNIEEKIIAVTSLDSPSFNPSNTITFIKNKKYLMKWFKDFNEGKDFSRVGIIFEERYYQELLKKKEEKIFDLIHRHCWFVANVASVNLAISKFSKPFYDQKFRDLNLNLDGRSLEAFRYNEHRMSLKSGGAATINPNANVAANAFIGEGVFIGRDSVIMSGAVIMAYSVIGKNVTIFPNVTIYPFVKIGDNSRIHSGTIIGSDGFGYNIENGIHQKVWHMGGVIINEDVEVGANSAIDAGTFSPTIIGKGTKIDNGVQIGHNCNIGPGVILCGQVGISGSVAIGDYTVFGGRAGIGPDLTLGKCCQVAGGALINSDWPDNSILGGHPARPLKEWMLGITFLRKEAIKKEQSLHSKREESKDEMKEDRIEKSIKGERGEQKQERELDWN
ncbi:MAG: UDP-3-O-(3-hydroxymyristoyl)glucosamine N-acyltransferase [Oligoflexia bacterium]|nr:UDP-3-O-(3-hydroxymyristoyl)glucosamine N-acyltransferase [Oligoflexia bacterium]